MTAPRQWPAADCKAYARLSNTEEIMAFQGCVVV